MFVCVYACITVCAPAHVCDGELVQTCVRELECGCGCAGVLGAYMCVDLHREAR